MTNLKKQTGQAGLLLIAVMVLLTVSSHLYFNSRNTQLESTRHSYEKSANELNAISRALIHYYAENMSWPVNLNNLVTQGDFVGDDERCGGNGTFKSTMCTVISGSQVGDNYVVSVNLLKEGVARSVSNQIIGGGFNGTVVTSTVVPPSDTFIYDDYLRRATNNDTDNTMEIDLDVNGNTLNGIGRFDAVTANIDNAKINDADVTTVDTSNIKIGSSSITASGSTINTGPVNINGALSLGGNVSANGNSVTSLNSAIAYSASANDFYAEQYNGGAYTSSGDFYTSTSSVNANYNDIVEQKNRLDDCVDVSKYCIPQNPFADLECYNCDRSIPISNFSAVATAVITDCRQGCSYEWVTSGTGINFSGCSSGSVSAGKSASATCNVSAVVPDNSSVTGSVKIVVTNNQYTDRVFPKSSVISFVNTNAKTNIADEISLVCDDALRGCRSYVGLINYKGSAISSLTVSVDSSSITESLSYKAAVLDYQCNAWGEGNTSNYGRSPEITISPDNKSINASTFANVQSSGDSAYSSCLIDVEFTVSRGTEVVMLSETLTITACAFYNTPCFFFND